MKHILLFIILIIITNTIFCQTKLEILLATGDEYYMKSNYKSALEYYKKALAIDARDENINLTGDLFHKTACVYQMLGSYELALENYYLAIEYREKINDTEGIGSTFNNIGIVYNMLEDYNKALEYYNKTLKIKIKTKNKEDQASTLNNIGLTYCSKKKYEQALIYYNQSLEIYKGINDSSSIALLLTNIGVVYNLKNNYESALKNSLKAYKIIEKVGNKYQIANISLNVGTNYLNLKNYKEALFYANKTLKLSQEVNSQRFIKLSYELFYKLYKKTNDNSKALKYHELYTNLLDSLNTDDMRQKISKMQIVYETEKTEKENQKLINDKKIKNIWLSIISLAFIIILLFFVFIYIQNKKIKKAYNVLVQRNIEIVESEKKHEEAKTELEAVIDNKNTAKEINKYLSSVMSDDKKESLLSKITFAIENEKMYLQNDLTIQKLSEHLNTNKNYISQIINNTFNKNFYNFINEYRIKEARILLSDIKNKQYTLEAIANKVGFKSRSSFNKAFKKFVGVTPSFFAKNV